jgi:flavin reductase (DIM6/NTAB) family NADH-FMN oxidoreductase RutF
VTQLEHSNGGRQVSENNVDQLLADNMRQAMRRLAASVVIITASDGTNRYAMAATASTSVSMEPPSMLVCVNRAASIYPVLEKHDFFGITMLGHCHHEISLACSSKSRRDERFAVGDWRTDPETGTPYLADAPASLICARAELHPYGSHGIFIGRVKSIHLHDAVTPLVYIDGRYTTTHG